MKIFKNSKFSDFWDVWTPRGLQIRIERIKRIQFGGANYEIREILTKNRVFFDFRFLGCRASDVSW